MANLLITATINQSEPFKRESKYVQPLPSVEKPACHECRNQDSSYLVSRGRVKVVIKASGGENGGGKDVAYTYSVVVVFLLFRFSIETAEKGIRFAP